MKTNKTHKFTTVMICRAGIIAALYAVLTWVFGEFAYNPTFEIRPAEALTILPLFYVEAIPGLYVGCMLANLLSGYGYYDIFIGSLATLLAAGLTYGAGRLIKNDIVRVIVGGIFPIVCNIFIIPAVMILAGEPASTYWVLVGSMAVTETVWVYALGIPFYFAIRGLQKKGVRVLLPYTRKKSSQCD